MRTCVSSLQVDFGPVIKLQYNRTCSAWSAGSPQKKSVRECNIDPAIAEPHDIRRPIPGYIGDRARILILADPSVGADGEIGQDQISAA